MKIAVVGKGGSGKTTTSAIIARVLARGGAAVVALDADSNPNLGLSLGVGIEETERLVGMRQALDGDEGEHASDWDSLLDLFGSDGPDGVRFAVVSQIDNPDPGCPCCGLSPEQLLGNVDPADVTVVADLEAGIGTLTRLGEGAVDIVVIVVEAMPKSMEVGTRAAAVAAEKNIGRVIVVANRIRNDADLEAITAAFPGQEIVVVPDDRAIVDADRQGVAPLDLAPEAPAVQALSGLAGLLVPA
ncbi:MAG: AAA family ATPase [Acidimicrobiales bacterium]